MNRVRHARREFLKKLPKNSVVAEIGVWRGVHAEDIFNICQPRELYLIDPWTWNTQWHNTHIRGKIEFLANDAMLHTKAKFKNAENVFFMRKDSVGASLEFEDNFFDWVYIDADHRCEEAKRDLDAWWPKIKKDGHLTGHDWMPDRVVEAAQNLDKPATLHDLEANGVVRSLLLFLREQRENIDFMSEVVRKETRWDYASAEYKPVFDLPVNGQVRVESCPRCWAVKKRY